MFRVCLVFCCVFMLLCSGCSADNGAEQKSSPALPNVAITDTEPPKQTDIGSGIKTYVDLPNDNMEPVSDYDYWDAREVDLPYVRDMYMLAEVLESRADGMFTVAEVEELLGIAASQERHQSEAQKDVYDFDYGEDAYISLAVFERLTCLGLHFVKDLWEIEELVGGMPETVPDRSKLSDLGFDATYKDYVDWFGHKGVLTDVVGDMSKRFQWYLADGNRCDYSFSLYDGTMTSGYGFWQ